MPIRRKSRACARDADRSLIWKSSPAPAACWFSGASWALGWDEAP